MGKTIELNLFSDKSIQNAIKALRDYENSLTYKCRLLAETLAENGVEIARVQIADLDAIFTSELIQSIHSEYVGSVKAVEYGRLLPEQTMRHLLSLVLELSDKNHRTKESYPKVSHGNMQAEKPYGNLRTVDTVGFIRLMMVSGTSPKECLQDHLCT